MSGFSDSGIFVVTASIGSVSASISVGSSVAISNWPAVVGVSGSVNVYTSGLQGISGSVNVTVSGSTGLAVSLTQAQGVPALSTGGIETAPANILDVVPFTVSLTGSVSASNGQIVPLKSDYQGNLANVEQFAPQYEDNFNGVAAVAFLPITASIYAPTTSGTFGGQPPVVKASAGMLYSFYAVCRSTGSVYLQFFNSTSAPAAGAVPFLSYTLISGSTSAGVGNQAVAQQTFEYPVFFSTGISAGFSSSPTTYVAATNPGAPGAGSLFDSVLQYK